MTAMTLDEIKTRIETMDSEPAITLLDSYLADHPDDDEALTLRGIRRWTLGKRSEAINDYLAALRINPSNSRAAQSVKSAYEILNFFNKDL